MRSNNIGKCSLLAIHNNIDQYETILHDAKKWMKKFVVKDAQEHIKELRAVELSVDNIKEHKDIVTSKTAELVGMKHVARTIVNALDAINELLKEKKAAIASEYKRAEKDNNGRLMVECQQELEKVAKEFSTNADDVRAMFDTIDALDDMVSTLVWYSNYVSVFDVCIIDGLTDEELQTKMIDLRLALENLGEEDKELREMAEQALQECRSRLEKAGYVWQNPYKEWSKLQLNEEIKKTDLLISNLTECSNRLLKRIMDGLEKDELSQIEQCDREIQRALLLAHDKRKALSELLNK